MKYDLILGDPSWPYNQRAPHSDTDPTKFGGGASSQYPLMSFEDIYDLPVEAIAAKNSVLLLWVVCPHLAEGIKTVERWGFDYKTVFLCWEKTNLDGSPWYGPGYYTGSNIELLLLGTRGSVDIAERGVYQVMREPHPRDPVTKKKIHSRKPEETFNRIHTLFGHTVKREGKQLLDAPRSMLRAELFARLSRPGWDAYGLDIDGRFLQDSLGVYAREEYLARVAEYLKQPRKSKKGLILPPYLERYRNQQDLLPGQLAIPFDGSAPFDVSAGDLSPAIGGEAGDIVPYPFEATA